jgi:hypothetical protein
MVLFLEEMAGINATLKHLKVAGMVLPIIIPLNLSVFALMITRYMLEDDCVLLQTHIIPSIATVVQTCYP